MPEIVLDLNGWNRMENVSIECFRKGVVTVSIFPPLDTLCNPAAVVPKLASGINVNFFDKGRTDSKGRHIFEA